MVVVGPERFELYRRSYGPLLDPTLSGVSLTMLSYGVHLGGGS